MSRLSSVFYLIFVVLMLLFGQALPCFAQHVKVGADHLEELLPMLEGRRIAVMANQTSILGENKTHLVDTLFNLGINLKKIFVPEHGFRGSVDAGKHVRNGYDQKTGLPIVSLYGRHKRPQVKDLKDVDVLIFDLQDVGTRFYTYISSMHYIMEAVAEQNKELIICDRPNPNDYVDGPMRDEDCKSFISMHKIPLLHGLTIGELALMINGEAWLRKGRACKLTILPVEGWKHGQEYELPIEPSPNLRDMQAIRLYPSLCLFEATIMSVGRGTDKPFKLLGYPKRSFGSYLFRPRSIVGQAMNPKHKGRICYGLNLSEENTYLQKKLSLKHLIYFQKHAKLLGLRLIKDKRTFDLLAGTKKLRHQIEQGLSEEEIHASWKKDLELYKILRSKYLIYPSK